MIKETLATGRISTVYRAVDAKDPQAMYAIKELSPVALFRPEERRAAKNALESLVERWAQVMHPNVIHTLQSFVERDKHYVVLEYVHGWSLDRVLADRRVRVTPDLARNWVAQMADLCSYLHGQSPSLHVPFLSPGHLMVTPEGVIKLIDLGLTHLFSPTTYGPYGGIRGYAAPELESAPPTVHSDIFSLGRVLYALLTGQLLEKHSPRQISMRQAVRGIPGQLVRILAQAMAKDPGKRFASMHDLRQVLWQDGIEGALQPVRDWFTSGDRGAPVLAPRADPLSGGSASQVTSMADMGFQRDPRFGPEPSPEEFARSVMPAGEPPRVSVYPHSFALQDLRANEVRRLVLTLRNPGDVEFSARVVSQVAWIRAPQRTVTLSPGKQAKVLLSLRAAGLAPGHTVEPQAIAVQGPTGQQWVSVSANIPTGPALVVEQPILDFGTVPDDGEHSLALALSNAGHQVLTGQVVSRVPWLRVPKGEFSCAPSGSSRVTVTLVPGRLPRGEQIVSGALLVDSDGGQGQVEARAWRTRPELDPGTSHMDWGSIRAGETVERYLFVGNTGDGLLEGTARSLLPWLQVHPQQFSCPPGELVQIAVVLDSIGLGDGILEVPQAIRLQTNGGTRTLSLMVQISAPKMVLAPSELAFGLVPLGETRERVFTVRNVGSAPLDANVQSMVPWLALANESVHCEPGQFVEIAATVNTALFQHGEEIAHPSAARIISGTQIAELPASMTVLRPALHLEPEAIDFGYVDRSRPESRSLRISNEGTGTLAWNAQTDAVWVEVNPRSGSCGAGESSTIDLTAYGLALDGDSAEAPLIINSDGGRTKVPLRVSLAAPYLSSDTTLLDLGISTNLQNVSASLRLFNHGLGTLRGTIGTDRTWLMLSVASFECAMGRSIEVQVSTDMDEFPQGQSYAEAVLSIESNGGNLQIGAVLSVEFVPAVETTGHGVSLQRSDKATAYEGRLVLKNTGMALAHLELRSDDPRIELARMVCDIKPGKSVRVGVKWQGPPPAPDEGPCYIEVTGNEGSFRVPVVLTEDR